MRLWFPEFSLFPVLILLLVACSGGLGGSARPTPVVLPTVVEQYPIVPGLHRYVEPGDRLSFPTFTPVPSPTPRPTPALSGTVATPTPTPTPELVSLVGDAENLSCVDQYRRMLVDYAGRVPLGAEVAWSLSKELKELRPDCVESGWAPLLAPDPVCVSSFVAGLRISPGLTRRLNSISHPRPLSSGRDARGNILLHFQRLPTVDRPGCWYYNSALRSWGWVISGVDSGVDRPRFPACDQRLRSLVAAVANGDFGPVHVARALDEARRQLPAECGSSLWNPFPESGSHRDCGVAGNTGLNEDGFLVITWHPEYLPSDYAVCWALPPGPGSWEFFYEREEE